MEYDRGDTTHTLQQEPDINLVYDSSNCLEELNATDTLQAPGESYFRDASLFHYATPSGHKSSITSTTCDTSTSDSNCSSGMSSEEGDSNNAAYSPELDSSVVDFDCDGFLYFTQNGKVISYE